ncbi:MAG TPA: FAD-dependent oxidoreductase [Spirochaetia bacterium]|nr:FAD-dependent oxidoreductase [Spirochaetia bacterium]
MEKKYDLAVIGGGLAGVCAAIAAARMGSKVALIQDRPVLGGNSSSEIRVPIGGACDFNPWARETGTLEELFLEDRVQNARRIWLGEATTLWDFVLYRAVKEEKNIDLFLDTKATGVEVDKQRGINAVHCIQIGSENELSIRADIFVDATGDATVAHKAGAETRMGREARSEFDEPLAPEKADAYTMGSSLLFHATDMGREVPFLPPDWVPVYRTNEDLQHRTHADITAGYWWIEIGNPPYNTIGENNQIRDELIKQLLGVWNHIKNYGDHAGAKKLFLDWFGSVPGKRESRRVMGDYILKEGDVKGSVVFEDRVAYGGWFIDLHTMGGILAKDLPPEPTFDGNLEEKDRRQMYVYSIPYRSLYSKDIGNLMMAGRDISVTHVALGSTRLMATCAVIGEAVGLAAFLCKKYGCRPKDLYPKHVRELQQQLLKQDCYIPHVKNEDEKDLARGALVKASSSAVLKFEEGEIGYEYESPRQETYPRSNLDLERAQLFPVTADRIDRIELLLESRCSEPARVELNLYRSGAIWDFSSTDSLKRVEAEIEPGCLSWVGFDLGLSLVPKRLYWIGVKSEKEVYWRYSRRHPVGTVSANRILRNFAAQKGGYAMRISPESRPFEAENLLTGQARPEEWTNIWISDPQMALPQSVEYDFGKPVEFNTVYLTFDTNLDMSHMSTPPLYRVPECVRDYTLYYESSGGWKELVRVKENYQRRRVHRFDRVTSRRVRLEISATNGDASARLYEMRVYQE